MMYKTVVNPSLYPTSALLAMFDDTPDAFIQGRRNNDMVNWFIAARMRDLEAGARKDEIDYIAEFRKLWEGLSREQGDSLSSWDETPEDKIRRLYQHYRHITDSDGLVRLWLPMDYRTRDY